ncbi:unnamed protein product, partial [Choristocarpus tenellus]
AWIHGKKGQRPRSDTVFPSAPWPAPWRGDPEPPRGARWCPGHGLPFRLEGCHCRAPARRKASAGEAVYPLMACMHGDTDKEVLTASAHHLCASESPGGHVFSWQQWGLEWGPCRCDMGLHGWATLCVFLCVFLCLWQVCQPTRMGKTLSRNKAGWATYLAATFAHQGFV